MPVIHDESTVQETDAKLIARLPFPPVTRTHILNCSYHSWHPKYRTISPKARLIPLTPPFLQYLRADGIVLPSDDDEQEVEWSDDSGMTSAGEDEEEEEDIAAQWRDVHESIKNTMKDLGGRVVPKLNWSAPKDATWMSATNSMDCRTPNDIYLLLKSSDFITHDLEHAFDDTSDVPGQPGQEDIPFHLVLRKYVDFNPSMEFRCFVRSRKLIALCQRDLNHFDFLFNMEDKLRSKIQEFFDVRLRDSFPDANFVFDVYVPAPHDRVWLVDVNPWAPRTDPLLFSWLELLNMDEPPEDQLAGMEEMTFRIPFRPGIENGGVAQKLEQDPPPMLDDLSSSDEEEADEELWQPEFRLVRKGDPEAYAFNTPQYSAHKLPKDVVDASQSGEGLREFAKEWREILAQRQRDDAAHHSDTE
ncbi:hypothetical protein AMS68_007241 [Peltaster fructicola]|uniref:Uncharacterized protein n=1 Tax=Peltaster fructicola TaxID=286661 RepID=A0A6H0Y3Y7_9PEZI|nr:hypothetical protein AMS68_007241 [Peltaster fructicola]